MTCGHDPTRVVWFFSGDECWYVCEVCSEEKVNAARSQWNDLKFNVPENQCQDDPKREERPKINVGIDPGKLNFDTSFALHKEINLATRLGLPLWFVVWDDGVRH